MTFTGRRNTGTAKRIAGGILDGLSVLGTALADSPRRERITEIESQLESLTWERNKLISELIEPGDLKVDDNFDVRRPPICYKPAPRAGEGRLTECEGQWSDSDTFKVHPGCPYKHTKHNKHEFTLND